MKNHSKRLAAPRTWNIDRKEGIFTVRPNAGGHSLDKGLPLGIILRDVLKFALTMGEAKKILNGKHVLVDGKRRKDHRFIVGLFDILSLPDVKKHYRMMLDTKGRLNVVEIPSSESTIKPCKLVGKKMLAGGKMQFNFHDGKNIKTDTKAKVGDTIVLSVPSLEVKEVLPLQKGSHVFLTKGKHSGGTGTLKEIKGNEAVYITEGKEVETAKEYLFVVRGKKAAVEPEKKKITTEIKDA